MSSLVHFEDTFTMFDYGEKLKAGLNEWMIERTNERANERINERMNE